MTTHLYLHNDKTVICLQGDNPADFLNDLLTAQIEQLEDGLARAACLLSPQGRILFDMLVLRKKDVIYLVTEADKADPLIKRLSLYRLRRAIEISHRPEFQVGHLANFRQPDQIEASLLPEKAIAAIDERHPQLGWLCLIKQQDVAPGQADTQWQKWRICNGIPEGAADLTPNRALMLEAGLDKLAAVDFKKGCYIGQEVTARTHYRGLVKRRLFPVTAPKGKLSFGAPVKLADKIIGQCGSVASDGQTDYALASLRLDAVQQAQKQSEQSQQSEQSEQTNNAFQLEDGTPLQLIIPGWMHPLPGFEGTEE